MKILITGINGMLGKDIARCFRNDRRNSIIGVGRSKCIFPDLKYYCMDLMSYDSTMRLLEKEMPDVIIHCAAMIGIAECERNKKNAYTLNTEVTSWLSKYDKKLVFISSDAVFEGREGSNTEEDPVSPLSYYANTKAVAEQIVEENATDYMILRTGMYGYQYSPDKSSVAQWGICKLLEGGSVRAFGDVISNSLYTVQIVEIIKMLMEKNYTGIMHIGSDENFSRYDFFKQIATMLGIDQKKVEYASVNELEYANIRGKNMTLNVSRMKEILGKEYHFRNGMNDFYNDYIRWVD